MMKADCAVCLCYLLLVLPHVLGNIKNADDAPRDIEADMKDVNQLIASKLLPILGDLTGSPHLSVACSNSLLKVYLGFRTKQPPALKMVLANGLLPTGLLDNNYLSLGSYEQCLGTTFYNSESDVSFKGQYCTLFVIPQRERYAQLVRRFHAVGEMTGRQDPLKTKAIPEMQVLGIRHGICTPSTCSTEEINFVATAVAGSYGVNTSVKYCRTNDPIPIESHQVAAIVILCSLITLVATATLVEWVLPKRSSATQQKAPYGLPLQILLWCSAITNTRRLLKTKCRPENEPIQFISGLKVIMAFWVVLGHAYIIVKMEFYHSLGQLVRISDGVMFQFITNAFLSVSTFLYMSGFVMSFSAAPYRHVIIKKNVFVIYTTRVIQRYVRLIIPLIVVLLAGFLVPLVMDGPADRELFTGQLIKCETFWWHHVILSSNFFHVYEVCMQHLWYVNSDMQILAVIAMPLLLLIMRHPKMGIMLGVSTAVAFCVLMTVQTYMWNLFYSFTSGSADSRRLSMTLEHAYFRPFAHVGTYVVGLLVGYFAAQYRNIAVHPVMQGVLWLTSFTTMFATIFITLPWNRGNMPSDAVNALYGGFHRLVWALAISWPMFACATGRGGPLNRFFSWKAFLPLGRLTYCLYLVNYLLYVVRLGRLRVQENVDEYFQLTTAVGFFGMGLFFAYILYICCDAPAIHLEKFIFHGSTARSEPDKERAAENDTEKSRL